MGIINLDDYCRNVNVAPDAEKRLKAAGIDINKLSGKKIPVINTANYTWAYQGEKQDYMLAKVSSKGKSEQLFIVRDKVQNTDYILSALDLVNFSETDGIYEILNLFAVMYFLYIAKFE